MFVYTDGSLIKSRENNKCGYGVHFSDPEINDVYGKFTIPPITNNRAELYAIYLALKITSKKSANYSKIIYFLNLNYVLKV